MYKDIKATSAMPKRHVMRVQFVASGREADCKVLARRTRAGKPEVRVERFGWLTFEPGTKIQVVK